MGACRCSVGAVIRTDLDRWVHEEVALGSSRWTQLLNQHVQDKVAKDPSVKAAVLISAKPDNFIAGADIRFIDTVEDFATLKDGESVGLGCGWVVGWLMDGTVVCG